MQYEMQIFEYEDRSEFRILDIDGEPWFVLGEVCRKLELKPKKGFYGHHADRLDDDEKRTVPASVLRDATLPHDGRVDRRHAPFTIIINESGLYSLILTSKQPEAKRFKKWVTSEVLPAIRRTGAYSRGGPATAFIKRYNENWDRIEPGYFSVINELVWWLWGRLAHVGHVMADTAPDGKQLRPDVSVGRLFADWLRKHHPDLADSFKTYRHSTPEAEVEARQYPDTMLSLFRRFVDTVWIPEHSENYFRTRDVKALAHLPKLLPPVKSNARLTRSA